MKISGCLNIYLIQWQPNFEAFRTKNMGEIKEELLRYS